MIPAICQAIVLGQVEYEAAWKLQQRLAEEIASGARRPTLLLLEHPHTYTFGRRGSLNNLLWSEAELQQRKIRVFWVDRGGDVTYHGPGQLVGYPLLPLGVPSLTESSIERQTQVDYPQYLRNLEEMLIRAVSKFGVQAFRIPGLTGVWVNHLHLQNESSPILSPGAEPHGIAKLAAIGVKVDSRGISQHGFALNVNPLMEYWQGIIGCGLVDHAVASLAELMPKQPLMTDVIEAVIQAFAHIFHYQMVLATAPVIYGEQSSSDQHEPDTI
jgi:lipoate-protein ligase B